MQQMQQQQQLLQQQQQQQQQEEWMRQQQMLQMQQQQQQNSYFVRNGRLDGDAASYGAIYNAGMMLDEQLDEEINGASVVAWTPVCHVSFERV